jgi:surface protein
MRLQTTPGWIVVVGILFSFHLGEAAGRNSNDELIVKVREWLQNETQALSIYGPIGEWDTSNVTTMDSSLFSNTRFDEDINGWDTSSVTTMESLFSSTAFDKDINGWDVSEVKNMNELLRDAAFHKFHLRMGRLQGDDDGLPFQRHKV